MAAAAKAPALLLMAEYNGTLAAARCLAGHGVPVVVATSSLLAPSRWSNRVSKVVRSPSFTGSPSAIAEWLLDYGRQHPKNVLYPTCDEMAWLIARHRQQLAEHYYLYSPELSALRTILDKRDLYAAAAQVGLATPRTWHPQHEDQLADILDQAPVCLVKPRSQTFFYAHAKGSLATNLPKLRQLWTHYRYCDYAPEIVADMQDIYYPMVQEFLPHAASSVYSISGFIDKNGSILASRGSSKILQLPLCAGIGVCFESVAPDPELMKQLSLLCQRIGYYGVFEVEFVKHNGQSLLIDFNPRYFGQMNFDIARGMELPWLAHLAALGEEDSARSQAQALNGKHSPECYADRLALKWHLTMGTLFGSVNADDRKRWEQWLNGNPDNVADAIFSKGDMGPFIASLCSRMWSSARHPRAFLRSIIKN